MKALELVVYPQDERGGYEVAGSFAGNVQYRTTYTQLFVDNRAAAKRLTDAELAAEYYAQDAQCRKEQWIETVRGEDDYTDTERAGQEVMYEWLNTLHRFATLPHYDEPTP